MNLPAFLARATVLAAAVLFSVGCIQFHHHHYYATAPTLPASASDRWAEFSRATGSPDGDAVAQTEAATTVSEDEGPTQWWWISLLFGGAFWWIADKGSVKRAGLWLVRQIGSAFLALLEQDKRP